MNNLQSVPAYTLYLGPDGTFRLEGGAGDEKLTGVFIAFPEVASKTGPETRYHVAGRCQAILHLESGTGEAITRTNVPVVFERGA